MFITQQIPESRQFLFVPHYEMNERNKFFAKTAYRKRFEDILKEEISNVGGQIIRHHATPGYITFYLVRDVGVRQREPEFEFRLNKVDDSTIKIESYEGMEGLVLIAQKALQKLVDLPVGQLRGQQGGRTRRTSRNRR